MKLICSLIFILCLLGCSDSPRYKKTVIHTLEQGILYIPEGYDVGKGLISFFPGLGSTAAYAWKYNNWKQIADASGSAVFIFENQGKAWELFPENGDVSTVKSVYSTLKASLNFDSEKSIAVGFSAGGVFIHKLILNNSIDGQPIFGAAVIVSGDGFYINDFVSHTELSKKGTIPLVISWGFFESSKPGYRAGEVLKNAGWDVRYYEHSGAHSFSDDILMHCIDLVSP